MKPATHSWGQILVEGAAIVASILLAFSIDAWWESRADREAEQMALSRLLIEFNDNFDQLALNKEKHQTALAATKQLLAMMNPDRQNFDAPDGIGKLLEDCLQNPTFNPRLGTTNSLIASGHLDLIRDKQLQSMLTEWPALADNLLEWQIIERMHGEELILPFTYDYIAWPDVESALGYGEPPSPFESDYGVVLSSLRFEGMLNNRRYNVRELIIDIETLEEATSQLLDRLRDQSAR